jgi:hypothetical protein
LAIHETKCSLFNCHFDGFPEEANLRTNRGFDGGTYRSKTPVRFLRHDLSDRALESDFESSSTIPKTRTAFRWHIHQIETRNPISHIRAGKSKILKQFYNTPFLELSARILLRTPISQIEGSKPDSQTHFLISKTRTGFRTHRSADPEAGIGFRRLDPADRRLESNFEHSIRQMECSNSISKTGFPISRSQHVTLMCRMRFLTEVLPDQRLKVDLERKCLTVSG